MADTQVARRIVGEGKYRYEFIPNWGKLPDLLYNNAVGIDSKDRVYVVALGIGKYGALTRAPLMYITTPDGEVLDTWGTGACVHAHGLSIVDDEIYVCDKYASVCLKYTLDGKILLLLGQHGVHSDTGCYKNGDPVLRAAGPFNNPDELVKSPWGDLYAADGTKNARVHRFDSGGHLIQSWGQYGSAPGEFHMPHSILCTKEDKLLYVCDRLNHRIQIFTREGALVGVWADDLQWPSKIVLTREGDFVVSEDPGNQINPTHSTRIESSARRPSGLRILDKEGKLITRLDVGRAHWIATDSRGDIYAATHVTVNKLVRL